MPPERTAENANTVQRFLTENTRLGIPAIVNDECLAGFVGMGATHFPQAIGMAASWDTTLIHQVATTISDEARAKHHESVRRGRRGIYEGLTFWSPNINIFRDPRWGRGMETYGEDPYLAGVLAVATYVFVRTARAVFERIAVAEQPSSRAISSAVAFLPIRV